METIRETIRKKRKETIRKSIRKSNRVPLGQPGARKTRGQS